MISYANRFVHKEKERAVSCIKGAKETQERTLYRHAFFDCMREKIEREYL
jgi:uncharacterized protein YnzC (UPF0291/DUF896 family)